MVVEQVEMKRKQNEIRNEHEEKDKLESLGQKAAKKTPKTQKTLNSMTESILYF